VYIHTHTHKEGLRIAHLPFFYVVRCDVAVFFFYVVRCDVAVTVLFELAVTVRCVCELKHLNSHRGGC
jgi:hypothetical protein